MVGPLCFSGERIDIAGTPSITLPTALESCAMPLDDTTCAPYPDSTASVDADRRKTTLVPPDAASTPTTARWFGLVSPKSDKIALTSSVASKPAGAPWKVKLSVIGLAVLKFTY